MAKSNVNKDQVQANTALLVNFTQHHYLTEVLLSTEVLHGLHNIVIALNNNTQSISCHDALFISSAHCVWNMTFHSNTDWLIDKCDNFTSILFNIRMQFTLYISLKYEQMIFTHAWNQNRTWNWNQPYSAKSKKLQQVRSPK